MTALKKGDISVSWKKFNITGSAEFLPVMDLWDSQYTYPSTRAVSRRKAKIKHIKHVLTAAATRSAWEVLYLQRWLRKNQDFLHTYIEGGEGMERRGCKKKNMFMNLDCPNLELFPINLALPLAISHSSLFNLKSARETVAPSLFLHKVYRFVLLPVESLAYPFSFLWPLYINVHLHVTG